MPRQDSHPVQFAAAEAVKDQPSCALIVWWSNGTLQYRTYPDACLPVLLGVYEMLGHAIDEATQVVPDDDEDE